MCLHGPLDSRQVPFNRTKHSAIVVCRVRLNIPFQTAHLGLERLGRMGLGDTAHWTCRGARRRGRRAPGHIKATDTANVIDIDAVALSGVLPVSLQRLPKPRRVGLGALGPLLEVFSRIVSVFERSAQVRALALQPVAAFRARHASGVMAVRREDRHLALQLRDAGALAPQQRVERPQRIEVAEARDEPAREVEVALGRLGAGTESVPLERHRQHDANLLMDDGHVSPFQSVTHRLDGCLFCDAHSHVSLKVALCVVRARR